MTFQPIIGSENLLLATAENAKIAVHKTYIEVYEDIFHIALP
ncbi:MAG: hypothetical protein V7K77_04220 [Nostoc sp.]